MSTTTAARRTLPAAVVALALLQAGPALAHSEGLTPYRYVLAPPGVVSEGPAEAGVSTQPIGAPGFAGTTDNQMQLTLPAGVLPPRPGERGVRVRLDQLDPAVLPDLPVGLEPEGNGYRVAMAYAASGGAVSRLRGQASLGLSAPAAPSAVYRLVGQRWQPVRFTPVAVEEGFTSVVALDAPGTFLQAYDVSGAPAGPAAARAPGPAAASPRGAAATPAAAATVAPSGDQAPGVGLVSWAAAAALLCLLGVLVVRRRWGP